ncbi:MAG: DNA-processing protein DprA [Betaproteobacteria bacterium]
MFSGGALSAWLRLALIPGIGGVTQRKLLTAFGLPEVIFSTSRASLAQVISVRSVDLLIETDNSAHVESALRWSESEGQQIVTLADPEYPQLLLQIPDPPILLYVRGRIDLLNKPALAIVGSRNPTPQGIQNAERFAAALSQAGLSITSGLALGIDAAAHRGALAVDGDTVAFIGTGIDRIYPAKNKQLTIDIAHTGAIVSEFPLGTPASASNFPRRNRLISGLSLGVLVVEAAIESGSLITSRLACEQGREVFAIPGSIHSPQSRGCHQLIKQGAKLVETVQDVLDELRWNIGIPPLEDSIFSKPPTYSVLLSAMGFDPLGIDQLAQRTGLPVHELFVALLQLELEGRVASLSGGRYQQLFPS